MDDDVGMTPSRRVGAVAGSGRLATASVASLSKLLASELSHDTLTLKWYGVLLERELAVQVVVSRSNKPEQPGGTPQVAESAARA